MGLTKALFIAFLVTRLSYGQYFNSTPVNNTDGSTSSLWTPSSSSLSQSEPVGSSDVDSSSVHGSSGGHGSYQTSSIGPEDYASSSSRDIRWSSSVRLPGASANASYGQPSSISSSFYSTGALQSSYSSSRPHLHNETTLKITGTGGLPPMITGSNHVGAGTGSSNVTTSPANWSNATMTARPGFAVYGNNTFRTNCGYSATDCYSTCAGFASQCWSEWYTWSRANQDYQTKMQSLSGTVEVPEKTLQYTFSASTRVTYYGYDVVETTRYTEEDTTVTSLSTAKYATSSSILSVVPESVSTSVQLTTSEYKWSKPAPTCSVQVCSPGKNCEACTISGGEVQLLYWPYPATTTSGTTGADMTASPIASAANMTASANASKAETTATSTATVPAEMVVEGVTITSPSVAISFATAYAKNDCNKTVGSTYGGSIVVLDPGDVSSLLMGGGINGLGGQTQVVSGITHVGPWFRAVPVNYADLNWPYALTAWSDQPRCHGSPGSCDYVVSGELKPVLAVPNAIRTMDSAWAPCDVDFGGLYDPPSALSPRKTLATPTINDNPHHTGPAPIALQSDSSAALPTLPPAGPLTPAEPSKTPDSPPSPTKATDGDSSKPTAPNASGAQPADPGLDPGETDSSAGESDQEPSQPNNDPSPSPSPVPNTSSQPIATIGAGSSAVTVRPGTSTGQVIANGQDGETTLEPGAVTTIASTSVSVDSTGNVVVSASSTVAIDPSPQTSAPPVTVVGTNTVEANPSGSGILVNSASTPLIPGQVTTVDNGDGTSATISVGPSNSVVVQNGESAPATLSIPASTPQIVGGQTVSSASNGGIAVGTSTISAGGSAATANGVTFTVAPDGKLIVASTSTASLNPPKTTDSIGNLIAAVIDVAKPDTDPISTFTADTGETFTAASAPDGSGNIVVHGASTTSTLVPGETALIGDQVVRVDSSGGLTVGTPSKTTPTSAVMLVTAGTFKAGGEIYTAIQQGGSNHGVIIDGTTLDIGEAVTVGGDTLSLAPTGLVEIDSDGSTSTIHLEAGETTVAPAREVEAFVTLSHSGWQEELTAYQVRHTSGVVEVDGHKLTAGGEALTTEGVTVRLGKGGSLLTKSAGEDEWDTVSFRTETVTRPDLPSRYGGWEEGTKTKGTKATGTVGGGTKGGSDSDGDGVSSSDASTKKILGLWVTVAMGVGCAAVML